MGGSKHGKKKQKRRKRNGTESLNANAHPSKKGKPSSSSSSSLASRLKKLRGTAESTELPPEWSRPCHLRRLQSSSSSFRFLSPSDGNDFDSCLAECYRGFTWQEPEELPASMHSTFDNVFDALYESGLFLYDAVQPGGRRLSRTFVTRTVIGKPGSTYRYLGLRLFSHPWAATIDANGATTATATTTVGNDNDDDVQSLVTMGYSVKCASALITMGKLNADLQRRTHDILETDIAPHVELVGSADYSLTLINRMEPTSIKKDLKQDREYGMGKTSVSWHKDSGLADFSSIAVYQSLRETTHDDLTRSSSTAGNHDSVVPWKVAVRIANRGTKTPPLCVPLRSGTLYYLLDDFNHNHEHTVVAGSNELRYSSTHRVAREGRGTWQYIRDKCRNVLMIEPKTIAANISGRSASTKSSLSERRKQVVKETRAQQQLLDELEFEWLRQWYIQGQLHARLHPYWHKPMDQLEGWFCDLERRTVETIEQLRLSSTTKAKSSSRKNQEIPVSEDLFDVLIEAMEARQKTRTTWLERLDDPIFVAMTELEKPFASSVLDRPSHDETSQLPENLLSLVVCLRKCRKRYVKGLNSGKTEHSELTKREKKTIASNWESMKASLSSSKK